jgi:hypothetical protein
MIERPTVLILGAGASLPSGYPLGEGLVKGIVHLTAPNQELYQVLIKHPQLARVIGDFARRLADSDTASIDDFLESNPNFAEIGKLAIAAQLSIWGPGPTAGLPEFAWYRYLWRLLHQGAPTVEAFRQNRLKVITYNYDRSLERYLMRVLHHNYPELAKDGNATVQTQAEAVPVVHLHGSLGVASDEIFFAPDRAQYKELAALRHIAAGIRIVHEEQLSEEYATAHAWLKEATVICFLGFGYHPTNLKRLDVLEQIHGRPGVFVGGSAYGMGHAEVTRAEAALKLGSGILKGGVHALDYLREWAPL